MSAEETANLIVDEESMTKLPESSQLNPAVIVIAHPRRTEGGTANDSIESLTANYLRIYYLYKKNMNPP